MLVNNYDVLWAGGLELQNKPVDLKKKMNAGFRLNYNGKNKRVLP